MKPVTFIGTNIIFGGEGYLPLPAMKDEDGAVITCWELSSEEQMEVAKTGKVYVRQLTFNKPLQPLRVESDLSEFFEIG